MPQKAETRDHLRRRLQCLHGAKAMLDRLGDGNPLRQMDNGVPLGSFVRLPPEDGCADIGINAFDLRLALDRIIEKHEAELSDLEQP